MVFRIMTIFVLTFVTPHVLCFKFNLHVPFQRTSRYKVYGQSDSDAIFKSGEESMLKIISSTQSVLNTLRVGQAT